jgi:hypothetical protein
VSAPPCLRPWGGLGAVAAARASDLEPPAPCGALPPRRLHPSTHHFTRRPISPFPYPHPFTPPPVTPLIAPFCLLYFALAFVSQKYTMIYVLSHDYEASGRMWGLVSAYLGGERAGGQTLGARARAAAPPRQACPHRPRRHDPYPHLNTSTPDYPPNRPQFFHHIMTGIYFLQAVAATVLGVKRFPYAALLAPLLVATAVFHWLASRVFTRPWALTSARLSAALDEREAKVRRAGPAARRGQWRPRRLAGRTAAYRLPARPAPLRALRPIPMNPRPPTRALTASLLRLPSTPPPKMPPTEDEATLRETYLNPAFKINDREHDDLLDNVHMVG